MAIYEWICRDCNIWWDRDLSVGKAPDRTRCPKCKKLSHRYWQQQGVTVSYKDDGAGNQNNPGVQDFHGCINKIKNLKMLQMMNLFATSLLMLTGINLLTPGASKKCPRIRLKRR